eukprot:TRINITY_DN21559_c0_g1_i1.p1 TRINITY_DN21559_c0_g1~~TRINITY_DN21559_c0_g1_i1.p1  ORF type:complete len:283 (-),score=30.09 TRINITY_DN21559_c0_g1_i1:437-1285(-)
MADVVVSTILAGIAYFVVALGGGAAVRWITRLSSKWMQFCNALAGGVVIGVSLCHILPDNVNAMAAWGQSISGALGGHPGGNMPVGLACTGYGFLFIVGIEHLLGSHEEDSHSHSVEEMQREESDSGATHGMESQSRLAGITTLVGISIHSVVEGIATGSTHSAGTFEILLFAVLLHKGFAAFAVAASLQEVTRTNLNLWWAVVVGFACIGPVGLAIGAICRANVEGQLSALLQCLAAGTLLAVGINEMLMPALQDVGVWKKRKLVAAVLGFSAMALLSVWT